jgi:hypothetical protein
VVNNVGRGSGLTINVWEYSHVSLGMAKVIVDLDAKKEKEFRDTIIKAKGFRKGVIKESLEEAIDI